MPLTAAQIERYSRQIIVPGLGGRGQERVAAARILLVGDARDIEAPLSYLVASGVGAVAVRTSGRWNLAEKIAEMRRLNGDVTVTAASGPLGGIELALLMVGSDAARKVCDEVALDRDIGALVIARLDAPGTIVVMPSLRSAGSSLPRVVGARAEAADFIAMLAAAEVFKLLAGYAENPAPVTIDFDGYGTIVRALT